MAIPSGVIVAWAGTNALIPAGWSRVTALDGRFVKQIATSSTAPGATGGAASHGHPYGGAQHTDHTLTHASTHTVADTCNSVGTQNSSCGSGGTAIQRSHNHTMVIGAPTAATIGAGGPTNYDSTTTDPPHLVVIFIKSNGSPTGIPNNALAYFNATAPTGWARYTAGDNRVLKGAAAAGDGGGTGGTGDVHTHTSAGHTHTVGTHRHAATVDAYGATNNSGVGGTSPTGSGIERPHTHTYSPAAGDSGSYTSASSTETSAAGDMSSPWQKMLFIQNTSGVASQPVNLIAMWDNTLATIPGGWKLCDGTAGTPNLSQDKFVRSSDTVGNIGTTGGAATHTHTGGGHTHASDGTSHTHVMCGVASGTPTVAYNGNVCSQGVTATHTHAAGTSTSVAAPTLATRSTTATANTSNDPLFTGIVYIQYQAAGNVPDGTIVAWTGTNASIPAGWTRETALDARFVKMVATAATNPNTTGGAATHDHGSVTSHTHGGGAHSHASANVAQEGGNSFNGRPPGSGLGAAHSHPLAIASATPGTTGSSTADTYGTTSISPPYFVVIFIKSNGTPLGVPNGAVIYFNSATPPTNWRACDGAGGAPDMRNRFWQGAAAAGDGGATGGSSDSHTHVSSGHTHTGAAHSHTTSVSGNGTSNIASAAGSGYYAQVHTHPSPPSTATTTQDLASAVDNLAAGDGQPSWHKLYAIQNNTGAASLPVNVISLWLGTVATIPADWKICDGTNGTPNLLAKYIKALNTTGELGNTGGAATHTHGGSHTHSQASHAHTMSGNTGTQSEQVTNDGLGCGAGSFDGIGYHTMPASTSTDGSATSGSTSTTSPANTSNDPAFTTVAYIMYTFTNTAPNTPSSISSPVAGNTYDAEITLTATATDPDTNTWVSLWEYSPDNTNWTILSGSGTEVASGSSSSMAWNTATVTEGSAYKVRAKARDQHGSLSAFFTLAGTFTIAHPSGRKGHKIKMLGNTGRGLLKF